MREHKPAGDRFAELLEIMDQLRGPGGCPWDKEQTHATLRSFLLEEAYELMEAIDRGDAKEIREELGDLLHQIVFHCQIAAENGAFDAADLVRELKEKIIRRHPHVFAGDQLPDAGAVVKRWAELKAEEKPGDSAPSSLGNLPRAMPALARAQKLTERASRVGFDWPGIEPVWQKLEEELSELRAASRSGEKSRIREELGDVFLSLVNLSRFLDVQAEDSLAEAVDRFQARFSYIETKLRDSGRSPAESSLEEMDRLWEEAKRLPAGNTASS